MGVDSSSVHDLAAARRELQGKQHYALCLTDLRLPDGDGIELLEWIQAHSPELPVAVITAHGNVEAAVRALKLGAFDFVRKPLDISDLRKLVNQALKLSDDRRTAEGGRRLIGDSEPMQQLRQMISRVARSQAPVHITGESGTGKELVARLIHESGPRKDAPFVPVSCGAIPSELMESELFGHRRGSFTGAVADKLGLVQAAEGGTLFLDEVADLPFVMQVKLLRLIQEKTARPVGDQREQPVDVRILSATHKDLGEMVAAGRFREDLYYRIDVIDLRVPSLRERLSDVPELAAAVTGRFAARMGMAAPAISDEAMELLATHEYPGNVRELENVIERALTLCDGGTIRPEDIELRGSPSQFEETVPPHRPGTLPEALDDIERNSIRRALEEARYNKTAAARALGISFRALRYRIKKLGIE
jgi:two-component system response regulator PilR (NtrC family)